MVCRVVDVWLKGLGWIGWWTYGSVVGIYRGMLSGTAERAGHEKTRRCVGEEEGKRGRRRRGRRRERARPVKTVAGAMGELRG